MANYAVLKAAINAVIKTNGNKEITGQVLNQTLMAIVDSLGENYQFAGVAVPSTNPGTPDQNIFYLATQAGTYTNFGAVVLPAGISMLEWKNNTWSSETFFTIDDAPTSGSDNLIKSGAVFDAFKNDGGAYDVSVHFPTGGVEGGNTYTLDGAIAMVPQNMKKGGMSIKFVSSSDNKYVQYRLTKDEWSTITSDWVETDSNKIDSKVFFVTDNNRNVIAKIDKDGVHSVDFKVGLNDVSLVTVIANEATTREEGDAAITGLVEAEEARAKAAEDTKLNYTITDDKFCITDNNGYIICQIDASGVNSVDVKVKVDEELVSVKTLIDKKLDQTLDSSILEVTDSNGYIIAKVDDNGVHSAKDKHAVACMVLSEAYYPTAAPTRDSDGNVTYAQVMFETGVAGSISITYTNGNSSSVAVVYGNYNYTITINRDSDGNVETVNVQ